MPERTFEIELPSGHSGDDIEKTITRMGGRSGLRIFDPVNNVATFAAYQWYRRIAVAFHNPTEARAAAERLASQLGGTVS